MIQTTSWFSLQAAPRIVLLGCLAVLLLGPGTARAVGPEARCTEIDSQGGTCTCSSTLNTTDRNTQSPKRCEEYFNANFWSAKPETGMPSGNTVDYVWQKANPTGTSIDIISAPKPKTSDKRVCVRYYTKFEPGFSVQNVPGDEREKIQEIGPGWGGQFQAEIQGTSFNVFITNPLFVIDRGRSYGVPDCTNNWCRFEQCFGASSGNLADGGLGVAEAWVLPLDGVSEEAHYRQNGAPFSFLGLNHPTRELSYWIANMYNQGNTSPNTRYASHAMAAVWASNAGQRIGAAREVESGGPPSTLGPPGRPVLITP